VYPTAHLLITLLPVVVVATVLLAADVRDQFAARRVTRK